MRPRLALLAAPVLCAALSGCIASTVVDVVTLPVRAVGAGVHPVHRAVVVRDRQGDPEDLDAGWGDGVGHVDVQAGTEVPEGEGGVAAHGVFLGVNGANAVL